MELHKLPTGTPKKSPAPCLYNENQDKYLQDLCSTIKQQRIKFQKKIDDALDKSKVKKQQKVKRVGFLLDQDEEVKEEKVQRYNTNDQASILIDVILVTNEGRKQIEIQEKKIN